MEGQLVCENCMKRDVCVYREGLEENYEKIMEMSQKEEYLIVDINCKFYAPMERERGPVGPIAPLTNGCFC